MSAPPPERVVVFRLEGERFGVDAHAVEEALTDVRPTPLPGLPGHVVGALFHRSRWLPVVDPAPALGLPPAGERPAAVVLRRGPVRFALAVDAVVAIQPVEPARLRNPEPGDGFEMVLDEEGVVTLLSVDGLFAARPTADLDEDGMPETSAADARVSIVVFRVGDAELGVAVQEVHEVLEYEPPTPVPQAPGFVVGVLDVRGTLLPVVDMRERLGVPAGAPDADTRILIADAAGERIGLVVDEVLEVARVPSADTAPPPAYVRGLAAEYLAGLARRDGRVVVLLRLDRILTARERLELRGAETDGDAARDER